MMPGRERWVVSELPLLVLTGIGTHLVMSGSQTLRHRWLGHRRWDGTFFHSHINFHHACYARGHLTSAVYRDDEGNNTPFFLIPTLLLGGGLFFLLPLGPFLVMALASTVSFYAHVYFDKAYHVAGSPLERFAWFRRKQQLHFVHHLHANANFAVIDFFWDRLPGNLPRARRGRALRPALRLRSASCRASWCHRNGPNKQRTFGADNAYPKCDRARMARSRLG